MIGVGEDICLEALNNRLQRIESLCKGVQRIAICRLHHRLNHLHGPQRVLQLDKFTRCDALRSNARCHALEVTDKGNLLTHRECKVDILNELLDNILTLRNLLHVHQWHSHPALKLTATHGRERAVDSIYEATTRYCAIRVKELEVADGEAVNPHRVTTLDARDR